jgi:uncharacterized protein YcbK (DUF882 family)
MKLTNNFSKKEFDSKDGAEMPNDVLMNLQKLAGQLQILRNNINKPITINSGYRSPEHNKAIGGVENSQHVLGKAADIQVKGISTRILAALIEDLINDGDMLQGGLGIYNSFVHYDIRKNKARWDYTK